ncbi:MAG TPA: tail fiber protein [Phycisphaerales bacterium]|nr:tail fiber protein [Phycisphaerales bacterium]
MRSHTLLALAATALVFPVPAFAQLSTGLSGGVNGSAEPFDNHMPGLALHMVMQRSGVFGLGVPIRVFAYSDATMSMLANGNSTTVTGWPIADGRVVSISQNQALFAQLGTDYGGNGATNFAIPDLRGRIIVGPSVAHPRGNVSGTPATTFTVAHLPPHAHPTSASPTRLTGTTGDGAPFSTLQPAVALDPVILRFGVFPTNGGPDEGGAIGPIDGYYGQVIFNAGSMTEGFRNQRIPCDGRTLTLQQESGLFSMIGYTYGSTHHNNYQIPDLRFAAAVGAGSAAAGLLDHPLGQRYGAETGTLTLANLPAHNHTIPPLGGLTFPPTGDAGSGDPAPVDSDQPAQVLKYFIAVNGVFPGSGINDDVGYIGEVIAMAPFSDSFSPAGHLPCDGRTLAIADYDTLFFLIGTTFGGDGISTFAIPDLRGRTPVGASLGWNGAPAIPAGTRFGGHSSRPALSGANVPPHSHTLPCPSDYGVQGGVPGQDNHADNNDFIVFIDLFFAFDPRADIGVQGGFPGIDELFNNNDFVVFIDRFFAGCP